MTGSAPIPQGPGVTAPFPAPPAEGGGARLGWALAVAGLFVVLCCGGGTAAMVGFVVTQVAATDEQSKAVVGDYLDALRDADYDKAYDLLCDEQQQGISADRFEARERSRKRLESYEIGEMDITTGGVPVTERYRDGSIDGVTYFLEADPKSGQLEICGRE
ncbi:hypothetical protein [Allorhizocola rhizosphaerae]|uniref:Rv0361 family membrane protein n=1 Tax=Allorhizocola rhizosphaerae TaxID=1872709 RepID=UPI000E3BA0B7|nr:hypothetical protein [Allorhizocola rhizosphaerae]